LNFLSKIFISNKTTKNTSLNTQLESLLDIKPKNISFYKEALTHKVHNLKDKNGQKINFERLEFLGDAIIETVVSDYLFRELPNANEGELTIMRSKIVNRRHLNELGDSFNITDLLSKNNTNKQLGNNISGNLYEALIGAIFLDKGYEGAKDFIYKNMITPHIDLEKLDKKIGSYKSYMIEWAQKNHHNLAFVSEDDINNGKQNYFKVNLMLNQKKISQGRSNSKKKAEEIAARRAYFAIHPNYNGKN